MAERRDEADWERTSLLATMIANANRDPRKHGPFKPSDFNPYTLSAKKRARRELDGLGMLKEIFTEKDR